MSSEIESYADRNGLNVRPQGDEIDLFELWDILWGSRRTIFVITFVSAILSVIYALMATEVFRARVIVAPAGGEGSGGSSLLAQYGGLASLAGINIGGGGETKVAVETLKSYEFIRRFILDERLLEVLFPEADFSAEDAPTEQEGVLFFQQDVLSLTEDKKTGLVTLGIQWTDPQLAANWANQLVKRINEVMRDKDIDEAKAAITFLSNKLEQTSVVEMRATLFRLIEAQTKQMMLANVRDEYAFEVIDAAYVPEKRVSPKRALICVVGTMFGGFLAVLLVFAKQVVNSYKSRFE